MIRFLIWLVIKKLNSIVTELFTRGRKLNLSLGFITQSYFNVLKDARLNSTHYLIRKIPNKRKLKQIAINHSLDIGFKDFIEIYKKCIVEPCCFLVNDRTLLSDNILHFRNNPLKLIYNKIMTTDDKIRDSNNKIQYS